MEKELLNEEGNEGVLGMKGFWNGGDWFCVMIVVFNGDIGRRLRDESGGVC